MTTKRLEVATFYIDIPKEDLDFLEDFSFSRAYIELTLRALCQNHIKEMKEVLGEGKKNEWL